MYGTGDALAPVQDNKSIIFHLCLFIPFSNAMHLLLITTRDSPVDTGQVDCERTATGESQSERRTVDRVAEAARGYEHSAGREGSAGGLPRVATGATHEVDGPVVRRPLDGV